MPGYQRSLPVAYTSVSQTFTLTVYKWNHMGLSQVPALMTKLSHHCDFADLPKPPGLDLRHKS